MFRRDFGTAGGLGLSVAERRHRRVPGGVGGGWRLAVSGSSGGRGGGQAGLGKGELGLVRMRRGHGERDPADRDADQGADLEEREAQRAACGLGELGVGEADAPQRAEQAISHGGEPEPQLVGAHGGGRGAASEEIELALLDAVLHLAAGAVDALVEAAGVDLGGTQRGDDEAWVGRATGPFGLADDAPPARPAVEGGPAEVAKAACRPAGAGGLLLRPGEVDGEFLDEARIAGEAEDEVDPVCLAPGHQRLAGEAAVGAQQDPNPGPAGADLPDNARDLLKGAGRGVDVGAAQPGRQQVPAAEDVERQVAVGVVVAVEEAALLMPVQGNVGRVEVEDDLPGWPLAVRLEEEIDEQRLDRRRIMADAVIAARLAGRGVFQPVQGALSGQGRAVGAPGRELAGEDRQHRVVAELVMIDDVLMPERDAENALADQGGDLVLDPLRRPRVAEAGGEARDQVDGAVGRAKQQRAGIRGDRPAVESGHHAASFDRCKLEQRRATLRRHRGPLLHRRKALSQKNFRRFGAPMHLQLVRYPG